MAKRLDSEPRLPRFGNVALPSGSSNLGNLLGLSVPHSFNKRVVITEVHVCRGRQQCKKGHIIGIKVERRSGVLRVRRGLQL